MKARFALVSLVLALAPAAAGAMCSEGHVVRDTASNCALGTHWDGEQLKCVPTTSS